MGMTMWNLPKKPKRIKEYESVMKDLHSAKGEVLMHGLSEGQSLVSFDRNPVYTKNECPTCGAFLHGPECEYCGNFYGFKDDSNLLNEKNGDQVDVMQKITGRSIDPIKESKTYETVISSYGTIALMEY